MEIPKPEFRKMCFMHLQQLTNFPYIEKDFDALTDYELLCKVVEYLNKVIKNENEQNETLLDLYNAYVYLKDYLENLDLQDYVNVKIDDLVKDGTLEDIVSRYLSLYTKECKFIFPKNWINGNYGSGDCGLILCENKSIMIDTSYSPFKSNLYSFLSDYNITHLDYVVISHYDIDHCGNLISLIDDGYIDENTTLYLPPYVNYMAKVPDALLNYTNIMNKLTEKNLSYTIPTENVSIQITDSLKFKFFNCDATFLNSTGWPRYNNYSMILLATHNFKNVLYTGDCNKQPLERLINEQFLNTNIDLYKCEHHSLEYGMNYTPIILLKEIKPEFAWVPANTRFKELTSRSITLSYFQSYKTNISAQFDNTENVEYNSSFNGLSLKGKILPNVSNATSTITYYVDGTTTNIIRNGTQTYPFKTIYEAIAKVNKNEYATISVAAGTYGDSIGTFGQKSIYLNGENVVINGVSSDNTAVEIVGGIQLYNAKLSLNNLTVHIDGSGVAINSHDSKIYTNNCIISGNSEETTKIGTGIDGTDSDIHIFNSKFLDLATGIDNRNSKTFIANSTYENVTTGNIIRNGEHSLSGNNVYTNVTTRNNITSLNSILNENLTLLFVGTAEGTQSITLEDDITQFNNLEIQIGSYATGDWTQYSINSYQGMFAVNDAFSVPSIQGYGKLTITGNKEITLSMPLNAYIRNIKATRKMR